MVALYNVVIKLPEYCFVDIKYKIIYLYPIYIFFQNLTEYFRIFFFQCADFSREIEHSTVSQI